MVFPKSFPKPNIKELINTDSVETSPLFIGKGVYKKDNPVIIKNKKNYKPKIRKTYLTAIDMSEYAKPFQENKLVIKSPSKPIKDKLNNPRWYQSINKTPRSPMP